MDIELASHNIDFGTIKRENGHFVLPYWANEKLFNCSNHDDNCKLYQNLKQFKKSKQPDTKNFSNLKQVKLKK